MKNHIKIIADTIRLVMDAIKNSIPQKYSELENDIFNEEDALIILTEADVVDIITDTNGDTFTDVNGDIIVF
jgi:hypothetical protein